MKITPGQPDNVNLPRNIQDIQQTQAEQRIQPKEPPRSDAADFQDKFVGTKEPPKEMVFTRPTFSFENVGNLTVLLNMIFDFFNIKVDPQIMTMLGQNLEQFTDVDGLVEFLQENNLNAAAFNQCSMEELKGFIAKGYPTLALVKSEFNQQEQAHWVLIRGFDHKVNIAEQKVEYFVLVEDPSNRVPNRISEENFMQIWSGVKLGNLQTGYENLAIAIAAYGSEILKSRFDPKLTPTRAKFHGLGKLNSGLKKFKQYWIFEAFGEIIGGGTEAIGGIIGYYLLNWGEKLTSIAQKIWEWCKQLYQEGKYLAILPIIGGLIAYAFVGIFGYVFKILGIIISGFFAFLGRMFASITTSIQKSIYKLGKLFSKT